MLNLGPATQVVSLKTLRPAQMTVGLRKVKEKRKEWAALPAKKRKAQMARQLFPAVAGPKGRLYIIDHHHNALALTHEGVEDVQVGLICDLSHLKAEEFWTFLDHRSWVHCYDAHGVRQGFDKIPKRFEDLTDDPYRSLAASVEDAGGFSKPNEPFYEFLWANHFRERIALDLLDTSYDDAVAAACELARSKRSRHLPGWAGPK